MRNLLLIGFALVVGAWTAPIPSWAASEGPPSWAWGFNSPEERVTPMTPERRINPSSARDRVTLHTLPGSKFSFSQFQLFYPYGPADWFPEEHPAVPDIVAHGRRSANPPIYACSVCHTQEGKVRPDNANLTGLAYEYIMRQLMDFRNGVRQSSDPRKTNTALMIEFAKAMTEKDMKAAALYFSSLPATPWIRVVEGATVPKTRGNGGIFLVLKGAEAGVEPIGDRIIEIPADEEDSELWRSPHSGFIAYAPPGSLQKGEDLVTTGAGKTTNCTVCHGLDLRGLGPVPMLAGRAPSYIVRQLYDMQHGNRAGAWTPLMASVIENLNQEDLLNAAAYLASLDP